VTPRNLTAGWSSPRDALTRCTTPALCRSSQEWSECEEEGPCDQLDARCRDVLTRKVILTPLECPLDQKNYGGNVNMKIHTPCSVVISALLCQFGNCTTISLIIPVQYVQRKYLYAICNEVFFPLLSDGKWFKMLDWMVLSVL
jgi:hypothetical protein